MIRHALSLVLLLASTSAWANPAWMVRHEGVWFLSLKGTAEEMGRQHGELARPYLAETALPYFADKIPNSIGNTYFAKDFPILGQGAISAIRMIVLDPLVRRIPEQDRKTMVAFAKAAGFDPKRTLEAQVTPDAGQWLVAQIFGKRSVLAGYFDPIEPFGCSTFVSGDAANPQGWLHARNLDYDGVGIFDRHPAVIYFQPTEPGAQRYVGFTSLGLHTAGITGINESGIALSLHQLMLKTVSRLGTPVLPINERLLREARTIDQAAAILKSSEFAGSWAVHVSSARERRAFTAEVSAAGVEIRWMDGLSLVGTNHSHSQKFKSKEYMFTRQYLADTLLRERRLNDVVSEFAGRGMGLQDAVDLISSSRRVGAVMGTSTLESTHGIIAKMNNIQSVVMAPDARLALVAVPRGPGEKPLEGRYVSVPLDFAAAQTPQALGAALSSLSAPLAASEPLPESWVRAHAAVRRATHAASDEGDFEAAASALREAVDQEPSQPAYRLLLGLTEFRNLRLNKAYENLEAVLDLQADPYARSLAHLFLGRIHDLKGERVLALQEYNTVETRFSQELKKQVKKHLKKPFKESGVRKVVVDYAHGDVFRF